MRPGRLSHIAETKTDEEADYMKLEKEKEKGFGQWKKRSWNNK